MARDDPTLYSMAPANRAFIGNFSQQPLGNLVWVIRPVRRRVAGRPAFGVACVGRPQRGGALTGTTRQKTSRLPQIRERGEQ